MIKSFYKSFILLIICVFSVVIFSSCAPGQQKPEKTVRLGYVNWAEGIAMTNLAKVILEDKMNYQVQTTMADVAPVYTSVANGDYDAFMDAWLPTLHRDYMEEYGDDVVDLGVNFSGTRVGLVVPEYVTIDSIAELNDVREKFDGKIIGIDAGAGIMRTTDEAIEQYDLDYELQEGSGPVMTASLKRAIDNKDWVAVTGWAPHWKFGRWDLKFLDDPRGVYGEPEYCKTIARKGIREDLPEVAQFLENFNLSGEQLSKLMLRIKESDQDPEEITRQWMNENQDIVNEWIPEQS